MVKNPPANAGDIRDGSSIPESEDALEEGMAIHSSILVWRIPWTEKPGGLECVGSQRVRHDRSDAAELSTGVSVMACGIFHCSMWDLVP